MSRRTRNRERGRSLSQRVIRHLFSKTGADGRKWCEWLSHVNFSAALSRRLLRQRHCRSVVSFSNLLPRIISKASTGTSAAINPSPQFYQSPSNTPSARVVTPRKVHVVLMRAITISGDSVQVSCSDSLARRATLGAPPITKARIRPYVKEDTKIEEGSQRL